jgi:hypothetical protein
MCEGGSFEPLGLGNEPLHPVIPSEFYAIQKFRPISFAYYRGQSASSLHILAPTPPFCVTGV